MPPMTIFAIYPSATVKPAVLIRMGSPDRPTSTAGRSCLRGFDAHRLGRRHRGGAPRSRFNGREPDEDRWDLDPGRLASVSGRLWLQASTGRIAEPEKLEPCHVQRTKASAAWFKVDREP